MSVALRERAVSPLLFSIPFFSLLLTLSLPSPGLAGQRMGGHSGGFRPIPVRAAPVLSAPSRPAAIPVRVRPAPQARGHRGHPQPHRRFGHAGHWRHPTPVWLDPNVYPAVHGVNAAPHGPAGDGGPDYGYVHPAYFQRMHRQYRCTAPKIIQIGPIDRQAGAGPRLIYGTRNPCGTATFQNLHKPEKAKRKTAKRGLVRKY